MRLGRMDSGEEHNIWRVGDGRLDQGADKMDDDIGGVERERRGGSAEKPRCLFKCSSSGLGLPGDQG